MEKISHLFLLSALTIVLLTAGCAGQQGSPTATVQAPSTATMTLTSTSTVETPSMTMTPNTTLTPGIPVTGWTASLVCQFCVDTAAHALLVMPAGATTTVLTPTASVSSAASVDIGCGTVETINDKQVVLCRAPSNTSMILNVCVGNDCQQFMVKLQTCPPLPVATATVTPTFTPTPSATPTLTPTVGLASPTFTPTVSSPTFTSTVVSSPTATDTSTPTATATATP